MNKDFRFFPGPQTDRPLYPFFRDNPMAETLTIPAHIENGSLRLDAPLPSGVVSVEVHAKVTSDGPQPELRSVAAYLESLPPGNRTGEEIDRQIKAERDTWPE